jgi:hypothetical protein
MFAKKKLAIVIKQLERVAREKEAAIENHMFDSK